MAGILDIKRRIMDAIITVDGRRQMAANTIDLQFATFSDEGIFYDSEDGLSARDISDLPILEVMSLPRDVIIPEVDDPRVPSARIPYVSRVPLQSGIAPTLCRSRQRL